MKEISLQELKRHLSRWVARAQAGETVVITKHGRPIAKLTTAVLPGVHVGKHFGKYSLRPAILGGTGGESLRILQEDRDAEPGGLP